MIKRKHLSPHLGDIESSHPTVADSIGDDSGGEPLIIQLGEIWSDLVRGAGESREPEPSTRSSSAVPLLDDMKGILQWD